MSIFGKALRHEIDSYELHPTKQTIPYIDLRFSISFFCFLTSERASLILAFNTFISWFLYSNSWLCFSPRKSSSFSFSSKIRNYITWQHTLFLFPELFNSINGVKIKYNKHKNSRIEVACVSRVSQWKCKV